MNDWNCQTYRACEVCDHGKTGACVRPEVAGRAQQGIPFEQARRNQGPCGPEAYYLAFPGLYRPGEAP